MRKSGKIDAKDLIVKIEKMVRERIVAEDVVQLQDLKKITRRKKTILVIEDDDIVRKSLSRIFENDGYGVLAAQDCTELSQIIDNVQIDLILMDIGLPWINGFELADLMKSHRDTKNIPLVFISGHSDRETIKKGFAAGADDYITKPFEIEKVRRSVDTLLRLT